MPNKSAYLSISEAAELMGVPVSTARSRLFRAKIVPDPGRNENGKMAAFYRRADVEKLIAEGFRPPGRPKAGEARR